MVRKFYVAGSCLYRVQKRSSFVWARGGCGARLIPGQGCSKSFWLGVVRIPSFVIGRVHRSVAGSLYPLKITLTFVHDITLFIVKDDFTIGGPAQAGGIRSHESKKLQFSTRPKISEARCADEGKTDLKKYRLPRPPPPARQAFWAFLAGSQKLAFLFPPSQTETQHA